MAAIHFTMNNLEVDISGVNGYMDSGTYTNGDPVDYVFKCTHRHNINEYTLFRLYANTGVPTPIPGFKRRKTDEVDFSFLGAVFPDGS